MQKLERSADLVETVKNTIFDAILKGQLVPGEKLSQDSLAEKLGVSRQPIGQALRMLLEHGIVCPLDKKSLTVAAISQVSLVQILDIRRELDSFSAGLAAERTKAGLLEESDFQIIEALDKLQKKHTDTTLIAFEDSVIDDIEFHRLIRALSGNPYVHTIMAPHLLHHHRLMYIMNSNRRDTIWSEHAKILDAIKIGDAELARSLVWRHIKDAADIASMST